MSAPEPIIPRDLKPYCERLYRALKNKPCGCQRAYKKGVLTVVKTCSGCKALSEYEGVRELAK